MVRLECSPATVRDKISDYLEPWSLSGEFLVLLPLSSIFKCYLQMRILSSRFDYSVAFYTTEVFPAPSKD